MSSILRSRCSKKFHSDRYERPTIGAVLCGQQHDLAHVAERTTDLHIQTLFALWNHDPPAPWAGDQSQTKLGGDEIREGHQDFDGNVEMEARR